MSFLTDEIRELMVKFDNPGLIDIQYVDDHLYYIFRTKEDKKIIYRYKNKDNYYFYSCDTKEPIAKIKDCNIIRGNYREMKKYDKNNTTFERDFSIENRHTVDFYLSYPENNFSPKILFLDIELDLTNHNRIPNNEDAFAPICMISYGIDEDSIKTLALKSNGILYDRWENTNTFFFDTEQEMLMYFCMDLKKTNVDILTSWFAFFDYGYIAGRIFKIGMDVRKLSLLNCVRVNHKYKDIFYSGFVILDMLELYKGFSMGELSSNKLDMVAQHELGEGKHTYEGDIRTLFKRDPNKMIEYNKQDVALICKINKKVKHIELQNKLRSFCGVDWKKSLSTIGLIDGLLVKFARKNDLAIITNRKSKALEPIRGAYVKTPVGGLYEWVIDLDYSSLYPSIIRTYNMGVETILASVDEKISYDYLYKNKLPDDKIILRCYPYTDKEHMIKISSDQFKKIIEGNYLTINGAIFSKHEKGISLYNTILTDLNNLRSVYKSNWKKFTKENKDLEANNNFIAQWAVKILANAMYGALTNENYRYFNPILGSAITSTGQELIKMTGMVVDYSLRKEEKIEEIDFDHILNKFSNEFYLKDTNISNVIYTDTDSIFIELSELLKKSKSQDYVKDILEIWAPYISGLVNKQFIIDKYIPFHGLDSKNCFLDVKQEWIAKTLYMVTKKRYALWMINENGLPRDEIKFSGLETKRSDVPKFSRDRIAELMELILKSENGKIDVQNILKYVNGVELKIVNLIKEKNLNIGKPVNFNKDLENYKNLPQHIKGMLIWNELLDVDFNPGTKGYLFPIKGIDPTTMDNKQSKKYSNFIKTNKFKTINCIVIPQHYDAIPDIFVIDSKRILDVSWKDIVNRILEPILQIESKMETF